MIGNFEAAVAFTYIDEKGNDDDPNDAGGRTSDGTHANTFNNVNSGDLQVRWMN